MNRFRNFRALAFFLGFLFIIAAFAFYSFVTLGANDFIAITAIIGIVFLVGCIFSIIQCVKCRDISLSIASEGDTISLPKKEISKKKVIIVLIAVLVLLALIFGIIIFNVTAWQRNFEIKYIGFENKTYSSSYGVYTYEITNLTSKTYQSVKAVIHVTNVYGDFSFEDYIGTIRQHEEKEYKLRWSKVEKVAEENGIELMLASADIERLKW